MFDLGEKSGVRFNIETKTNPREPRLTPEPAKFTREVIRKRVTLQSFDFPRR